jgi:hypothetical protein
VIAYREIRKPTVDVSLVEDNEDCISFDIEGGMRGRSGSTRDARRAAARSIAQRPGRDPAAEESDAPPAASVLDDGAVGFVDSLQARDVPGSRGDAGPAGRSSTLQITRGAGTPRSAPPRNTVVPPLHHRAAASSRPM